MGRNIIILISILIICLSITACKDDDRSKVDKIEADSFSISYGKNVYHSEGKIEQKDVDVIVESYNSISVDGVTSEEINYDEAITIIFSSNDKISGKITIDDLGVCRLDDDADNYRLNEANNVYDQFVNVYNDLKMK